MQITNNPPIACLAQFEMPLLVVAYPEFKRADFARIQAFRKAHDFQYKLIEPHFTLLFPLAAPWTVGRLSTEIEKSIDGVSPFDFCLRCATINKDAFSDLYHLFLVPDEGFSKILKLHDKLYDGELLPHRSLDIDYIPHITAGNSTSARDCLEMVTHWNDSEFEIWGSITHLDLIEADRDRVRTLRRFKLG